MMKADKRLYTFFQRSNTTNDEYMKEFDADIKVIDSYGGENPYILASLKPIPPIWEYRISNRPRKF